MKVTDIANAVSSKAKQDIVGVRPGEKLHEQMIGPEDCENTYEYDEYYKILPQIYNWSESHSRIKDGRKVGPGFQYSSEKNKDWMTSDQLKFWIESNKHLISGT